MTHSAESRTSYKSPERALAYRLSEEAGLNLAQVRVAIELFTDHLQAYHSDTRPPGTIVHTAVSKKEPAGKPIKHCKCVPVRLSYFHEADVLVFEEEGSVELRALRIYRWCVEAKEQGGLLSQEDLAFLLCVDRSTVRDLIQRLIERGLIPPTRGRIKDMGPDPSHKRLIADWLGRGYTTNQVRALTKHSEGAIGRYQLQFGRVLFLLRRYPQASEDQLIQLSELSPKAFRVYAELARELKEREDCRPHLERIRRRYELDPEGLAQHLPPGKRPDDLSQRRLRAQNLSNAIRQTIQEDLGTTTRVAEAVGDDLMQVIEATFQLPEQLRPGETVIFADAHDPAYISGEKSSDRPVLPVAVPLYTEEIQAIWRMDVPVGRRRARIATMIATTVEEQGAVMSVAGLAELLHVSPETMGRDLRNLAIELHIKAPTKGLLEDMGPTITHKDWIVDLDRYGFTGDEIAWLTRHAPTSRDRYIGTFRRAEIMMRLEGRIPSPTELAKTLRLRLHVAKQYVDLLEQHHGPGNYTRESAATQDP
jgi:Mn-dependent DtxR family transcriptional regulator